MPTILFVTSGATGSGRVVRGLAVGEALRRQSSETRFVLATTSGFGDPLSGLLGIEHRRLDTQTTRGARTKTPAVVASISQLVSELNPSLVIVDLVWFLIQPILSELPCPVVALFRAVDPAFLHYSGVLGEMDFDTRLYAKVVSIEPPHEVPNDWSVEPLVLRNRDEVLSKETATRSLGLDPQRAHCLILQNGNEGEFEWLSATYDYLADEGYEIVRSTNYREKSLFPAVDYFNAFDFVVTGAGYNSVWECVFFEKECVFVPMQRVFENQNARIDRCRDYRFQINGADRLVHQLSYL